MARTNSKIKKAASHPKPQGLAKRVQFGARLNLNRVEFAMLVEVWEKTNGKPRPQARNEIASKLGRCAKQVSNWFSNRRQKIRDAEVEHGYKMTQAEKTEFLWTKYRASKAEKDVSESSGASCSGDLTDATPELARASSADVSEYSVAEAPTPAHDDGVQDAPAVSPFDCLLQAAKLAEAEDKQALEACEALLGLHAA